MADTREPNPIPEEVPLTCQWCRNAPVALLVIVDWPSIGRHTSLVCDPCGDERVPEAIHAEAMVWRYRLAPIKEKADA